MGGSTTPAVWSVPGAGTSKNVGLIWPESRKRICLGRSHGGIGLVD